MNSCKHILFFVLSFTLAGPAFADEHYMGYTRNAETSPKGSWEVYQFITSRQDKGIGKYSSWDTSTEVEYSPGDRFQIGAALLMQDLNTSGIVIDGYMPKDKRLSLQPVGGELEAKYMFLSPAKDDWGLSVMWSYEQRWIDPHSGQKKDTKSFETTFILQKFFLEGQMVWMANFGIEATAADRAPIDDLPAGYDWPTDPEMEIETTTATGLSYRFIPNWYIGAEAQYQVEYETEVGRERFSLFAGPSLHYGSEKWWATLTYFPQVDGGGEKYPGQANQNLHLIEKTKTEARLKVGFNF